MIEFTPWPKTPRLFRDAVITEKIDGTNAAVVVEPWDPAMTSEANVGLALVDNGSVSQWYAVGAQSRSRLITPEDDNFGFARWVREHQTALAATLGPGVHFGEWWGSGIQRGYGLTRGERRFSLFNVHRYEQAVEDEKGNPYVPGLGVVPVLDRFTFSTERVEAALEELETNGSHAAPGFDRPEGVVVFHSQSRSVFKALLENDHQSKTQALEMAA